MYLFCSFAYHSVNVIKFTSSKSLFYIWCTYFVCLLIVIHQLLLSFYLCSKIITLSSLHCIYKLLNLINCVIFLHLLIISFMSSNVPATNHSFMWCLYLNHLVIVIIHLLMSVYLLTRVITLSMLHCIYELVI